MITFASRIVIKTSMMTWKNNKQQNQKNQKNSRGLRFACLFSASHLRVHKRRDNF